MEKIKNNNLLKYVEANYLKLEKIITKVGDKIKLGIKIEEGGKTRIQFYEGVIISKKNSGLNQTITVRKTAQGIGVEKCFLLNSPKIQSLKIIQSAKVRRSKLYYLRELSGKSTRLKEKFN